MPIPEHSILQLTGRDGTAEFNVDPGQDTFRLTMGKETKSFKKIDLFALIFAIMGPDEQEKMLPVRQTEVVTYRRVHNVKLKKAMPAGAIVKVSCEMNVEKTVAEGLKGMIDQQKAKQLNSGNIPIIGSSVL